MFENFLLYKKNFKLIYLSYRLFFIIYDFKYSMQVQKIISYSSNFTIYNS